MALGRYVVDAVLLEGRSAGEVRAHGISRYWLYKLIARYREGGYADHWRHQAFGRCGSGDKTLV